MNKHYRHGDLLLIASEEVPIDAIKQPRQNGRLVVAEGEATGHNHSIATPHATMREFEGVRWIEAPAGAEIEHQEHKTIALPPGTYRVVHERTYHAGMIERVRD